MSDPQSKAVARPAAKFSLDTWAVIVAFLAVVVVRLGLIHVPW